MRGWWLFLGSVALAAGCAHGRDEQSGPDGKRIGAVALGFDTISDDTIDVDESDATDWRYVELTGPGMLTLQLHWDDDRSNLQLGLHDGLGQELASGDVWGQRGRQLIYDAPAAGRYYVRVAGETDRDRSSYSVKALFAVKKPKNCHDCTVGQKACVAKDAVAVCQQTAEGCNAWADVTSCAPDQTCRDGVCAAGCTDQCQPDERRCASGNATQLCTRGSGGCMRWGLPMACDANHACEQGRCRRTEPRPTAAPKPTPAAQADESWVRGKIISMYTKDGQRTLHIEVGEAASVKPGMTGQVLEGSSDTPVDNGQVKVVRVTGNFCIATTSLEAIGNNRNVRIKVR